MALHLEDRDHAVADVDDAGVLAGALITTTLPVVGSVRSHFFEDLYEQCSFHMAEKMPSSVSVGSRPIRSRMRWYSSGFSPCSATSAGEMRAVASGMSAGLPWPEKPLPTMSGVDLKA